MKNGRFEAATADDFLTILMNNARSQLGNDLNDDEEAVIRMFYVPVANVLADIQQDIRTVLNSAQLDYAEGMALELLTALINVSRQPGQKAKGEITFNRESAASVDYTIPIGTVVQTDSNTPVKFETTETATLSAGATSVSGVAISAVETGPDGNVGPTAISVMTSPPAGIETAENAAQTKGGRATENDENLRARAQDELSDGMRATAKGIRNELKKTKDVKSVTLFINDGENTDADGLLSHHNEAVVEGGTDADVGQTLWDSKGAGDGTQGGIHGTLVEYDATVANGQTHPVEFSRPTYVQIYVDMDLSVNGAYGGDDAVKDAIIQYLGGTLTSGNTEDGELRAAADVVYTKVLAAILSINGIEDVPSLTVGTSASPTGTTNVTIANTEVATGDGTDGSINITEV